MRSCPFPFLGYLDVLLDTGQHCLCHVQLCRVAPSLGRVDEVLEEFDQHVAHDDDRFLVLLHRHVEHTVEATAQREFDTDYAMAVPFHGHDSFSKISAVMLLASVSHSAGASLVRTSCRSDFTR